MLILVEATYGSGKTLLATNAALHEDCPVYANYELDIPNYNPLVFSEIMSIDGKALIIIDEAHMYINARRSGQPINVYLGQILFQSRKMDKDFILTDQLNRTVDVNFREMADFFIRCQRVDEFGNPVMRPDQNDPLGFNDRFTYSLFSKDGSLLGRWEFDYNYAKKYLFPIYKTKELISAQKDINKELTLVDPVDTEKATNDIIDGIQDELPGVPLKEISKGIIEDYVLTHRYPKIYVNKVYSRLKSIILKQTYKN
jgi:hypothetical protein